MSSGLQNDRPYPLTSDVIGEWQGSRTRDMADAPPGSMTSVYHRPGARRLKDPDWEPVVQANLFVGARLAAQNNFGPDGAALLVDPLDELLKTARFRDLEDRVFVYSANDIHNTWAYKGLYDLKKYGLPKTWNELLDAQGTVEHSRSPEWARMVRMVLKDNANLIEGTREVISQTQPFTLGVQGWQVLGNCIVAVARTGGEQVNEALFRLRTKVPELKGNDPTVSPLDYGMAAHITVAIFGDTFTKAEAAALQLGLNALPQQLVEVPLSSISVDLQAYDDRQLADGKVAGNPLTHIARIAEASLGVSLDQQHERQLDLPSGR